jgi:predicted methyltransferase
MTSRKAPYAWLAVAALVLSSLSACASRNTAQELSMELAAAGRPAADVARDAGRKAGAVLAFVGVEPGMPVLDLLAAAG